MLFQYSNRHAAILSFFGLLRLVSALTIPENAAVTTHDRVQNVTESAVQGNVTSLAPMLNSFVEDCHHDDHFKVDDEDECDPKARDGEDYICFKSGHYSYDEALKRYGQRFCRDFANQTIDATPGAAPEDGWRAFSYNLNKYGFVWTYARVIARSHCVMSIDQGECNRIMEIISTKCYRQGGYAETECATWLLDPGSHDWGGEGDAPPGNGIQNPPPPKLPGQLPV